MKKTVSLLLVFLLIAGMMPLSFADGIDSFDPVQALAEQSVWNYITEFGSLAVEGQVLYSVTDGQDADVTVSNRFYYDPDTDNPVYVSEESSSDYYLLKYLDCKPNPFSGSYVYDMNTGENETSVDELNVENLASAWNNNIGFFDLSNARLKYSEENYGEYIFCYDVDGKELTLYFDAETGWLRDSTEEVRDNGFTTFTTLVYTPCDEPTPDRGYREYFASTTQGSGSESSSSGSSGTVVSTTDGKLSFHTKDVYGNDIDSSIIEGKNLVFLNFWEPWCGWCLKEMPDMEKLYRKYMDQGLLFIGVYKRDEDATDEEALEEIQNMGITYPIIQDCAELQQFTNDGWPCTYVFDGDGNRIGDIIDGYKPEDAWEELIIQNLLR